MLNITNAAAILEQKETGQFGFDVTQCPVICPNLSYYAEITHSIEDGQAPMIMRMQAGSKGDLWIEKVVLIINEFFETPDSCLGPVVKCRLDSRVNNVILYCAVRK